MFPFIFDQHKHFSQVFKIHFLIKEVSRLDGGGVKQPLCWAKPFDEGAWLSYDGREGSQHHR